jgi:hypothetical protein
MRGCWTGGRHRVILLMVVLWVAIGQASLVRHGGVLREGLPFYYRIVDRVS